MRKICVITATRAEYGLLYWTMKALKDSNDIDLQLCVTGMHLSPEFGLTFKQIEADGFFINEKVEILMSSDTAVGITKSMGLAMIGFSEAFSRLNPDLILVLGDRFEIFSAVSAAMIARIPIAHCHGGEATEGLIDEAIRHSITKMSHLHFASTDLYCRRIIQLGERPENVYNVGALGIENINKLDLPSKVKFQELINFDLGQCSFLVTFHPITLDFSTAENQFQNLLDALADFPMAKIIFTKPNADTDGRIIISMIDQYVHSNPKNTISFISMGQLRYLSAMKYVDLVIGNSSSGILESPSFKRPTINIGDRQNGRIKADCVIDCPPEKYEIISAIKKGLSLEYNNSLKQMNNPYGNGNSSEKIINVLQKVELKDILKKQFYNIKCV